MNTRFLAIIVTIGLTISIGFSQTIDTLTANPNPFLVSTDITIQNLNSDTITLKIYDRWGVLVETFFQNLVLSGTVTITFNANTLPDGQYLAALTLNSKHMEKWVIKGQSSSGVKDKQIDKSIVQVFPNPTVDFLTISSDKEIIGFELYDLHGRQLLQSKSGQQNTIDLKDFDNGLYLLFLKTNDMNYIKRIIKK